MCNPMAISKRLFFVSLLALALFMPPAAGAEDGISFNFSNADIRSVIKSVAKITGKNFIIDPDVSGEVTIVSSEVMAADELYSVFLSVLQVHGYAAVEAGDMIKIIPVIKARQEMSSAPVDRPESLPGDLAITKLYKLRYVPASEMVVILRPLVSSTSYMVAHAKSNMLIMVDRAANIDRLIRIIKSIDQAATGETEIVKLQYASSSELVQVIASLEVKADKRAAENLQLIADERTNSILLSGDTHYVLRAKALIAHLDTPVENEGSTQVIFLRNSIAKDLVPILNGIVKGEAAGVKGKDQTAAEPVTIQADEASNALVITASPSRMRNLQAVVTKLDIRRAQLMIEAIIAEVSIDKANEFGVQWRSTDSIASGENAVFGGTNFNVSGSGISQVSVNPLKMGDGLSLGFLNGSTKILGTNIVNLGALVRALAQEGDTNILSTPSLMTMDNEEAEIVVGQNVPFPTGSYTSSGTTSSSVNPFTTYERHDVGIKLKVKPQINEGNTIRLDITQEVSSVVSIDQNAGPTTNTRTITTSVLVDDGKMLVLGGLISDDVQDIEQRVPLLGKIPLLGFLFRYKSSKQVKRNLMVFLRPVIVRDEGSSSRITFDKYDYMRELQQNYGKKGPSLPSQEMGE